MTIKRKLEPFELCEFANNCNRDGDFEITLNGEICRGKDPNRKTEFSCGLRNGLLMIETIEKKTI
jgi:hypothetical protein